VKDITPGLPGSRFSPLVEVEGALFFTISLRSRIFPFLRMELWKSDGTEAGTLRLNAFASVSPTALPNPESIAGVDGTLFFAAVDSSAGSELWRSDGTEAGTAQVKDIRPGGGSSSLAALVDVGGTLFFTADDGLTGQELWKSDGTEAGTVRVKDVAPGSAGGLSGLLLPELVAVNGTLFFTANDGITGTELWRSDGTEAGTEPVKDIAPGSGSSIPTALREVDGRLVFAACDGKGCEPWTSDGTEAGTFRVADVERGPIGSNPGLFTASGPLLFFAAQTEATGQELWALPRSILLDLDDDGVPNEADLCARSPAGQPVSSEGCTAPQLIARRCPREAFDRVGNYVSCVARAAQEAAREGLTLPAEKSGFVRGAARNK
jgi:ELWxxDGT repeat protein